jgi:tRNA-dihydrouridine synthase
MMIGRAGIGYHGFFNEIKHFFATGETFATIANHADVEAARNHLTWSMDWKARWV